MILTTVGFETGDAFECASTTGFGSNVTISSAVVRSGNYSMRINPLSLVASNFAIRPHQASGSFSTTTPLRFVRFYFRVAAFPTAGQGKLVTAMYSVVEKLSGFINPDATLSFKGQDDAVLVSGIPLQLNTWHMLEIYVGESTATEASDGTYIVKLDGQIVANASDGYLRTSACVSWRFGSGTVGTVACDIYYDDIAVGDDWIGPGYNIMLPCLAAVENAWTPSSGTSLECINSRDSVSGYISTSTIYAVSSFTPDISALPHNAEIVACKVAAVVADMATTGSIRIGLIDRNLKSSTSSIDPGATYRILQKVFTYDLSDNPWSISALSRSALFLENRNPTELRANYAFWSLELKESSTVTTDQARWRSAASWENWTGNYRLVGDTMKLPYSRIAHIGAGFGGTPGCRWNPTTRKEEYSPASPGQVQALWRVGQMYSSGNDTYARTNLMSIRTSAAGATEIGETLTHATNPSIPAHSVTTELGIYCASRNGYAEISQSNTACVAYPKTGKYFYAACWFKSDLTDYSSGLGYIIVHRDDSPEGIAFAIYVDTDNLIKAYVKGVGVLQSTVHIDTEWHYAMIISSPPGVLETHTLVVDNVEEVGVLGTAAAIGNSRGFCVKSINIGIGFNGIAGAVDEIVVGEFSGSWSEFTNYRYAAADAYSPIIDTRMRNAVASQMKCNYETPDNTFISIAIRADNTAEDVVAKAWSGYISTPRLENGEETDVSSLGSRGQYAQIKLMMTPSSETSLRQISTPSVTALLVDYDVSSQPINMANSSYLPGQIIGQNVNFTGSRFYDKLSMVLTVCATDPVYYITAENDAVSFQAANFQSSNNPSVVSSIEGSWISSGTTLRATAVDALDPPYLRYEVLFASEGVYDLWGYGQGSFRIAIDDDVTDLRTIDLGTGQSYPQWSRFGSIYTEAGVIHSFSVYFTDTAGMLDQWYFTSDANFMRSLSWDSLTNTLPLSSSPFNTLTVIKSAGSANTVYLWKSSSEITASGKFNYEIPAAQREFINGLSIEFRQFGGNSSFCALWNYSRSDASVGQAYRRDGFGEDVQWES
jgi:hypothetical protein